MKRHDEIKDGLEHCAEDGCKKCPYEDDCNMADGFSVLAADALAYIQQIEADNAKLNRCIENMTDKLNAANDEVAKLQAERDAAVSELIGTCQVCRWEDTEKCADCHFNPEAWNVHESKWEWRGVQKIADHLLARGVGLNAEDVFHNVLILPCDIGETIYEAFFTKDGTGSHICAYICSGIHIADKVTRWRSDKPVRYFVLKTEEGHSIHVRMDKLGKTLFLAREEAEEAMRKGRKDHEE